jgi:hypothetical protein
MQDNRLNKKSPGRPSNEPTESPDLLEPIRNGLGKMDQQALMQLRQELDTMLSTEIGAIDLVEELGLQYRNGKNLLSQILNDNNTAPNQKAQVFNSVQSQLETIIKRREEVYSQERLKAFEAGFLKAMKALPNDAARHAFFDRYGEYLKDPDMLTAAP